MNIKKKELKRILVAKDGEYTVGKLMSDGSNNFTNHLISKGADICHAQLLSICLLFECMYRTVEDIRLIDEELPISHRSKTLLKYFKECAALGWSWWVINELGSEYCDLVYDVEFLEEREKDVEKAWNIINEWRAEKFLEWERAQFCPDD